MEKEILSWLSEHGFPLEMRVAQQMTNLKFQVIQSAYFSDFDTGTPREIDLLCRLLAHSEPADNMGMSELETLCATECKSNSKPWIVFKQTKPVGWPPGFIITSKTGWHLLHNLRKELSNCRIEEAAVGAGHGVREAFTTNDRAFTGIMSALKAAESTIIAADKNVEQAESSWGKFRYAYSGIAIPVVVISGLLFECSLGEDGLPAIKPVQSSAVVLRYPRPREIHSQGAVVHIVTEAALSDFLGWVREYHEILRTGLLKVLPPPKTGVADA